VIVNYSLNRNWTFKSQRDHRQTMVRYAVMLTVNVVLTLLIVLVLTHNGVYYLLSKLIAVAIIASINFFAGRHWVFSA
jgi:putative flippase GtrA